MVKLFKILLISISALALFGLNTAYSVTISAAQLEKETIKQISKDLDGYTLQKYEVNIINIPVTELTVPDGKVEIKVDKIATKNITSRMIARVSIFVNDKFAKSIGLPVEIKAYKNVLVARYQINRDELITADKVEWKSVDITNNTRDFLREEDLQKGVTALKTYMPNEAINMRFAKITPAIAKNSVVKVVFTTNGTLSVSTEGIALSDGRIGDVINIENKTYKKIYTGKVIDENKVLIEI